MKKILIWDYELKLKNSGGPAGYLYNIKEYLMDNPDKYQNITFLSDIIPSKNNGNNIINTKNSIIGYFNNYNWFKQRINVLRFIKRWSNEYNNNILGTIDLNKFDVIHFHVCSDVLRANIILKDYKGEIILTSHSPQPTSYEISDLITDKISLLRFFTKKYLIKKELKSWKIANKIMFPVEGATEPYKINHKIKTYLENNKNKLLFCPSSILDIPINTKKENIYKRLNIPTNSFIITYIGRHNIIKGYDQLKIIGKAILENYPNAYMIIAGDENPIKRLKHDRWIELGWINYGNDLIASSDLFILPNKETYFDLITLEVLRAGTPILMTRTGGNKHFSLYSSSDSTGIFLYDYGIIDSTLNIVEKIIKYKNDKTIEKLRNSNRTLFLKEFTTESFLARYTSCIENSNNDVNQQ